MENHLEFEKKRKTFKTREDKKKKSYAFGILF
jgi:hypothetical protein